MAKVIEKWIPYCYRPSPMLVWDGSCPFLLR